MHSNEMKELIQPNKKNGYKFSKMIELKMDYVFQLVGVKSEYSLFTKCLVLMNTLKGKHFSLSETKDFLRQLHPSVLSNFSLFLSKVFSVSFDSCLDALSHLFVFKGEINDLSMKALLTWCYSLYSNVDLENCIELCEDFSFFLMKDEGELDLISLRTKIQEEMIDENNGSVPLEKLIELFC